MLSRAGSLSDVIVGNDEEFGFMAGGIEFGLAKARDLANSSATIVVYKKGPEGAVTFADGEEIATGVFPVDAVKPTGAGDSFLGAFISAYAEGRSLTESIWRGSASAAMVVTRVGCAPAMPDASQIDQFINERGGLPE